MSARYCVFWLVRAFKDFALTECLQREGGICAISPACRFKGVVSKSLKAVLAALDSFTLAGIARNSSELSEMLEMRRISEEDA